MTVAIESRKSSGCFQINHGRRRLDDWFPISALYLAVFRTGKVASSPLSLKELHSFYHFEHPFTFNLQSSVGQTMTSSS